MKPLERIHIWFLKSDQYIKKKNTKSCRDWKKAEIEPIITPIVLAN